MIDCIRHSFLGVQCFLSSIQQHRLLLLQNISATVKFVVDVAAAVPSILSPHHFPHFPPSPSFFLRVITRTKFSTGKTEKSSCSGALTEA